jgi:hypothetical protein
MSVSWRIDYFQYGFSKAENLTASISTRGFLGVKSGSATFYTPKYHSGNSLLLPASKDVFALEQANRQINH